MKLEFVLPVMGTTGGAERALAALARHITASSDWEVTIQTTCASSIETWENDLPAGLSEEDGLSIHRHLTDTGRGVVAYELSQQIHRSPTSLSLAESDTYFQTLGPVSSSLVDCLAGSTADLALHMPYEFWTTTSLARNRHIPTVMWPAAHNDPVLLLASVREALCVVDGLVFGSEAERRLTQTNHAIAHKRQIVLGVGVQDPNQGNDSAQGSDPNQAAAAVGADDGRPWIVCVGRMLPGKGTHTLAQLWSNYVRQHKPDHRLIFVGEPNLKIKTNKHTHIAGEVDEQTKWELIRGADVLIHPGRLESFSIVLLEAWASNTPVLVNAYCDATSDHVRNSNGGAIFRDTHSFNTELHAMLTNAQHRQQLAQNGHAYWQNNYTWQKITPRFMDFCQRIQKFSTKTRKQN